ncbi:ArsR/SmtB family transcription factor [Hyphobacterium sp.]|uniref:ArsR/SmtB family transcription factor n=1 Tax=Hyphobacterium sp. TaxID=2004662 RepID=UPI003B523257
MDRSEITRRFAALGHDTRLRLFRLLLEQGRAGLAAGAISRRLDILPSTLTPHLQVLERSGLIGSRRDSRSVIYSLNPDGLRELVSFLVLDCCEGRPELCGLTADALEAGCA